MSKTININASDHAIHPQVLKGFLPVGTATGLAVGSYYAMTTALATSKILLLGLGIGLGVSAIAAAVVAMNSPNMFKMTGENKDKFTRSDIADCIDYFSTIGKVVSISMISTIPSVVAAFCDVDYLRNARWNHWHLY